MIKSALEELGSDVVWVMWEPTPEDSLDGACGGAAEPLKSSITIGPKSVSSELIDQRVEREIEKSPIEEEDGDEVTPVEWHCLDSFGKLRLQKARDSVELARSKSRSRGGEVDTGEVTPLSTSSLSLPFFVIHENVLDLKARKTAC